MTDLHDLECMMAASPAFTKLLDEYAEHSRVDAFETEHKCAFNALLVRNAMSIGYLRWTSCDPAFITFPRLLGYGIQSLDGRNMHSLRVASCD